MNNKRLTVLRSVVTEGPNKPGRPRRERLDDVKEWCNIAVTFRAAQDRELLAAWVQQWTLSGFGPWDITKDETYRPPWFHYVSLLHNTSLATTILTC